MSLLDNYENICDGLYEKVEDVFTEYLILALCTFRGIGLVTLIFFASLDKIGSVIAPLNGIIILLVFIYFINKIMGTRTTTVWITIIISILVFIPQLSFYSYKMEERYYNQNRGNETLEINVDTANIQKYVFDSRDDKIPEQQRQIAIESLKQQFEYIVTVDDFYYDNADIVTRAFNFLFQMIFTFLFLYFIILSSVVFISNALAEKTHKGKHGFKRYWEMYGRTIGLVVSSYTIIIALCFQTMFPSIALAMWFVLPVLSMFIPIGILYGGKSEDIIFISISQVYTSRYFRLLVIFILALLFFTKISINQLPEEIRDDFPIAMRVLGRGVANWAFTAIGLLTLIGGTISLAAYMGVYYSNKISVFMKEKISLFKRKVIRAPLLKKVFYLFMGLILIQFMILLFIVSIIIHIVSFISNYLLLIKDKLISLVITKNDENKSLLDAIIQDFEPKILQFGNQEVLYAPTDHYVSSQKQLAQSFEIFTKDGKAF